MKHSPNKLHLGCGPIKIPGWLNIDRSREHQPDMLADVTMLQNLFLPETIDLIYTCHMLEHLAWPTGVCKFLEDAFIVLKKNGIMRIVVPDLMKVAKLYVAGDDLKCIYGGDHFTGIDMAATRFMYFCRAWEHSVLFDERLLRLLLTVAGFTTRVMIFNKSDTPALRGLDRFESESIVIEAQK